MKLLNTKLVTILGTLSIALGGCGTRDYESAPGSSQSAATQQNGSIQKALAVAPAEPNSKAADKPAGPGKLSAPLSTWVKVSGVSIGAAGGGAGLFWLATVLLGRGKREKEAARVAKEAAATEATTAIELTREAKFAKRLGAATELLETIKGEKTNVFLGDVHIGDQVASSSANASSQKSEKDKAHGSDHSHPNRGLLWKAKVALIAGGAVLYGGLCGQMISSLYNSINAPSESPAATSSSAATTSQPAADSQPAK